MYALTRNSNKHHKEETCPKRKLTPPLIFMVKSDFTSHITCPLFFLLLISIQYGIRSNLTKISSILI